MDGMRVSIGVGCLSVAMNQRDLGELKRPRDVAWRRVIVVVPSMIVTRIAWPVA
jgi:hypothetical protein